MLIWLARTRFFLINKIYIDDYCTVPASRECLYTLSSKNTRSNPACTALATMALNVGLAALHQLIVVQLKYIQYAFQFSHDVSRAIWCF